MHHRLRMYEQLVPFIGKALGENVEIALHELTSEGMPIIALYNGQMSGRKIGDPLTSLGEHIIQTKQYIENDYVTNYKSLNDSGKVVRSSSFFIKDENEVLIGMMCINVNISDYEYLQQTIQRILGIDVHEEMEYKRESPMEIFSSSLEETISQSILVALKEMGYPNYIDRGRLTSDEKMMIVRALYQQGVFNVKGAIPIVANQLASSEPTIYRYLKKI